MDNFKDFNAKISLADLKEEIKKGLRKRTLLDQRGNEEELEQVADEALTQLTERGNDIVYLALAKYATDNAEVYYRNKRGPPYGASVSN